MADDQKIVVVTPKVVEQIFSVPKLKELSNDKLLELLNGLLEKLPNNWNGQAVERVEEKTKYGSKIYNVYGMPIPKWTNDINTLKKVIVSKNIMSEEEITKKIVDRVAQVRSEKNIKPAARQQPEEKLKEELTKEDIIKLINVLLSDPKVSEISWNVSIKKNIKELDKIDHEAALLYHDKFITLTKEKAFLKK